MDNSILILITFMKMWIKEFSLIIYSNYELLEETINTIKEIVPVKKSKVCRLRKHRYLITNNEELYIPWIFTCRSHREHVPTN